MGHESFLSRLLDLLYPYDTCIICGKDSKDFYPVCRSCMERYAIYYGAQRTCPLCGRVLEPSEKVCRFCSYGRRSIFENRSVFLYDGKVKNMMYRLKYGRLRYVAKVGGEVLARRLEHYIKQYDFMVSVPLHKKRQKKRGFNQADLIAKAIKKEIGMPYEPRLLKRIKNTAPIATLPTKAKRKEMLKDAFMLTEPDKIVGKDILIVDDIYTTGTTMDTIADLLLEHGARKVAGLTLCIRK